MRDSNSICLLKPINSVLFFSNVLLHLHEYDIYVLADPITLRLAGILSGIFLRESVFCGFIGLPNLLSGWSSTILLIPLNDVLSNCPSLLYHCIITAPSSSQKIALKIPIEL